MEKQGKILWVDDEIDLLNSYFIFLEDKGYEVEKATNGIDALELINVHNFDIVFLDENMPGLSGLETLSQIKQSKPNLPIVMITKNEAENIMDLAIGKQIADSQIHYVFGFVFGSRKHNGFGYRQANSRLSDKTCQSESDSARTKKTSAQKYHYKRTNHIGV